MLWFTNDRRLQVSLNAVVLNLVSVFLLDKTPFYFVRFYENHPRPKSRRMAEHDSIVNVGHPIFPEVLFVSFFNFVNFFVKGVLEEPCILISVLWFFIFLLVFILLNLFSVCIISALFPWYLFLFHFFSFRTMLFSSFILNLSSVNIQKMAKSRIIRSSCCNYRL